MWCFVSLFLVVSTSAIDCLERLVSKMTYYVFSGTLNPTHSLTHYLDELSVLKFRNQKILSIIFGKLQQLNTVNSKLTHKHSKSHAVASTEVNWGICSEINMSKLQSQA